VLPTPDCGARSIGRSIAPLRRHHPIASFVTRDAACIDPLLIASNPPSRPQDTCRDAPPDVDGGSNQALECM